MSTEDIQVVADVLNAILNPDNTIRKEAEAKFNTMKNNIPGLIFCLSSIISGIFNFYPNRTY